MRLRLVIQRHGLPATRVIWTIQPQNSLEQQTRAQPFIAGPSYRQYSSRENSVATSFNTTANSSENSGYTVSQLLADVNEVIPIEAHPIFTDGSFAEGRWALEDYIVEFLGSECLHFMEVGQLFKDGDEVVIRPLEYEDLAARRLTGRHQIAANGSHLIDGVPFGQQYTKESVATWRPDVIIPPRNKRRRLENGAPGDIHSNANNTAVRYASIACDSQQSAMATDDRHPRNGIPRLENGENQNPDAEAIEFSRSRVDKHNTLPVNTKIDIRGATTPRTRQKRTSFNSEKSNKNAVLNLLRANSTSCSEEHSSSSSVSSSDEEVSSPASISTTSDTSDSLSATSTSSSDDSSLSDTDSTTSTKSNSATASKDALIVINPPGKGSNKTKHNNFRVKLRRRLANLKTAGLLPKNANFEDLRAWDRHHGEHDVQDEEGETHTKPDSDEATEFERRRAQLLQDLQSGGVDVSYPPGTNRRSKHLPETAAADASLKSSGDVVLPAIAKKTVQTSTEVPTAPDRSKRLDLDSTRRLLFGSLGVKTPKTKDEEEKTRDKLSKKASRRPKVIDKDPRSIDENAFGTETISPLPVWQDTIMLKATECVYDDISLTAPPFPFIQRWDSDAQEAVKSYRWHQQPRGKKRKRNRKESVYDNYNEDWENSNTDVILDYDGVGEDNNTMQNTSQSMVQVNKKNNEVPDVDPDLTTMSVKDSSLDDILLSPEKISSLADATGNELRSGAIIAFKELDVSKATNWQPCVSSYRIAEVEEIVESSLIRVRLATRDRTRLTIHDEDTDGRRQYSKFEMPGYDEGEVQDDGVREIDPQQLIEPKLVYPAPTESLGEEVAMTPDAHLPVLSLDPAATAGHESHSQAKCDLDIPSPAPDIIFQLLEEDVRLSSKADSDLYILGEQSSGHQVGSAQNEQLNFHSENSDYSPITGSPVFKGFRASPGLENPSISSRSPSISQLNSTVPPSEPLLPIVSQDCTHQILGSSDGICIPTSPSGQDGYNASSRDQKPPGELQASSVGFPQLLTSSFVSATGEPAPEERQTTHQSASDNSSVVTNPFYDVDQIGSDSYSHTPTDDVHVSSGKSPDIETPVQKGRPIPRVMTPDDMTDPVPSSQIEPMFNDSIDQVMDSQVPQGSCVVDLTLTSDPIPSDNSDGDFMPPRKPVRETPNTTKRKTKRRNTKEAPSRSVRDCIDVEGGQSRPRRKRSQLHRSLI